MQYFISTKYNNIRTYFDAISVQVLSIGITCIDGREYSGCTEDLNVVSQLKKIRNEIKEFVREPTELWGYQPSIDWILFCGLFGKEFPANWPECCRDIKCVMDDLRLVNLDIQNYCKGTYGEIEDPLCKARWIMKTYKALNDITSLRYETRTQGK